MTHNYINFHSSLSPEDRWLFRESARTRLGQPLPQIIGWLERVAMPLQELRGAENVVSKVQHVLHRISVASIFD